MLSEIAPEDKVLYIDTDAIVKRDISNVWKYKMDNYYVAGVKDLGIEGRGTPNVVTIKDFYINSGFVIFHLKKMREDGIPEKIFELLRKMYCLYPDQDALNLICHGKTLLLPSIYNLCDGVTLTVINKSLVKVYHYAGLKDCWVINRRYAEEWYEAEEAFHYEFGW